MDYATLWNEISNDPLGRGYAGMSDAEIAASLNAANITVRGDVSVPELGRHLMETSLWAAILDATESNQRGVADAAGLVVDLSTAPPDAVDLGAAGPSSAFDSLVSAGIITQAERDRIEVLGDSVVSRADQLALGAVTLYHVQRARALFGG